MVLRIFSKLEESVILWISFKQREEQLAHSSFAGHTTLQQNMLKKIKTMATSPDLVFFPEQNLSIHRGAVALSILLLPPSQNWADPEQEEHKSRKLKNQHKSASKEALSPPPEMSEWRKSLQFEI